MSASASTLSEYGDPSPEQVAEVRRLDLPEPVRLPAAKRALDVVASGITLILTLPISALIVVAEVLESLFVPSHRGPILYFERRVSAGRPFRLPKFRILKVSAIKKIEEGARPKRVENQPENLTNVGKMLKKTGLDELPQMFSILVGDMSFIGPRPKPVAEYDEEIAHGIRRREVITAGLSGPAQLMKGSARTPLDELIADLRYIDHLRSAGGWDVLRTDLRHLGRTVRLMLKMTGE